MTPRQILTALLSMQADGFYLNVGIHMDRQSDFDVIAAATGAEVMTKVSERGLYDVAKLRGAGGADITMFGPERDTRLHVVK